MSKKKILIICRSFYPQKTPRAHRATELVKEFHRQGHDVTVLKPQEDDKALVDFLKKYPVKIKTYGPLTWFPLKSSNIKWIGDWKRKFGRLLFLLFEYPNIQILWKLIPALKKERNSDFDLMISIAVPHEIHWAISFARSNQYRIAKNWVADCGDPFMGNELERIKPPFYFSFFEKKFCNKADYISVPTQGSIEAFYPKYHKKLVIIPQGFSFSGISLCQKRIKHLKPNFAYAGGVAETGVRSLNKIIEYLLNSDSDFKFYIFSRSWLDKLKIYKQKAPDKIFLREAIPRDELLYELSKMDFLINLDNGTTRNTPSKLIDYSLSQRPILNISGENPNFNLLDEFLLGNYEQQHFVENLAQYDIRNVTNKFLSLDPLPSH